MFHVKHSPDFPQLVESIRVDGPILPVYYFESRILDGNKRALACFETGRMFETVFLESRSAAARLLFTLHPDRAHAQFAAELSLLEACELLGASTTSVLNLRRGKPKVKRKYAPSAGLKMQALIPPHLRRRWKDLLSENSCSANQGFTALLQATSDPECLERFRYYLMRDRELPRVISKR